MSKSPRLQTLRPKPQLQQPQLKAINPDSWHGAELSARKRGYTTKWEKARLTFLQRHPLCRFCEKEGRLTPATVVDHAMPHRGDNRLFWDTGNWQPLCATCHSSTKQREENKDRMPKL